MVIYTEEDLMEQEVKNLLKGVSMGGDYIGGNSTVNYYYGDQAEAQREGKRKSTERGASGYGREL